MSYLADYLILRVFLKSIRSFRDYPAGTSDFQYKFSRIPQLKSIFAPFNFAEITRDCDTFSKARRIMKWVAENTAYNGGSPLGPALPDRIIEFGIHQKNPINCANRAILFCDILVSLGVFAYPIELQHRPYLSKETRFADECHCHVIAQAWLPEQECWAAFDPSFNTYFRDKSGDKVSVAKMAQMVRRHQKIISIDNTTNAPTNGGSLCTRIGLLDISVSSGNDFSERNRAENKFHLLPESYVRLTETTASNDSKWSGYTRTILDSPKLCLLDIDKPPQWWEQ